MRLILFPEDGKMTLRKLRNDACLARRLGAKQQAPEQGLFRLVTSCPGQVYANESAYFTRGESAQSRRRGRLAKTRRLALRVGTFQQGKVGSILGGAARLRS